MIPDPGDIIRRRHTVAVVIRLGAIGFAVWSTLQYFVTLLSVWSFTASSGRMSGSGVLGIPSNFWETIGLYMAAWFLSMVAMGALTVFADALARAIVPLQQPRCPRCGYALTRLVIPECPECGLALPREFANAPDPRAAREQSPGA